jgi:hypothetical protein
MSERVPCKLRIARTARGNRKLSGTAPGNRHPPSAELSDCGLGAVQQRDARPATCDLRRPIVQNKPNWSEPTVRHHLDAPLRETNPIRPGVGGARSRADERCKTNPIRRPPVRPWRVDSAKQTQFRAATPGPEATNTPNEPNWRADCAKRSQTREE